VNPYNNTDYYISYKCTTDSECLSNKCSNNYCVFNEETPIIHCDNIYIYNLHYLKRIVHICIEDKYIQNI